MTDPGRRRRGRRNYLSGLAAEEQALRAYGRRGAEVLARRWRCAAGELDLVVREGDILVFVEVKRRRNRAALGEAITERQWRRLGLAAEQYMLSAAQLMGAVRGCRFDAVLVGADGSIEIIENAHSFDEC